MTHDQAVRSSSLLLLAALLLGPGPHAIGQDEASDTEVGEDARLDPRAILDRYPAFQTETRIPALEDTGLYPCTDCHDGEFQLPNPQVRKLEDMHDDIDLVHGAGRFWCLTCHHENDRDHLVSLEGEPIEFDEGHLLCGQCHFQRQRDFFFGAHGKRLESWRGDRLLTPCTGCHDPHDPAFAPREPAPPPPVRAGLEHVPRQQHHQIPVWETPHGADGTDPQTEPGSDGDSEP